MSNEDLLRKGIIVVAAAIESDTSTAISGQITVTTAGTSEQGPDVSLSNGVIIKALAGNTGKMYIASASGDNRAKWEMSADQRDLVQVANLNELWFDASVNGEKVCWLKA